MKDITNITQISKADWKEIQAACQPVPGLCVTIEKSADQLTIGLSEGALKNFIYGFLKNLGAISGTYTQAQIANASCNPPS